MNIEDIINSQDESQNIESNDLYNYSSIHTAEQNGDYEDILDEDVNNFSLEEEEEYEAEQQYSEHRAQMQQQQFYSMFSHGYNFGYFSSRYASPYAEKQRIQKLACAKLLSKQRQTLYYFLINRNIYKRVAEI
eukprot:TRINITY_DN10986_c0_g1_i1.p1 TRINITY_DN10986_c0_g1~~TRINITY_DN10986_c0_g1_i1.p1  ORF type:complete len:133 (+),score=20.94 TRINITY_DN10986_c0_g1_i1:250-648(+)